MNQVSGGGGSAFSAAKPGYALAAHTVPFLVWLGLMFGLAYLGEPAAWKYAVRAFVCAGLFIWFRPWQWYERLRVRHLPAALFTGVLVFVIWAGPEITGRGPLPGWQEIYLRFGILPLGELPQAPEPAIYAPEVCGWLLSLVRLAGSALILAVIEEFLWRGFLYRWLIERRFLTVHLHEFDAEAFVIGGIMFGLEHHRWLAGILAGAAYTALMLRTRDIWAACFAHVVTNLLLGLYVLATGAYVFW